MSKILVRIRNVIVTCWFYPVGIIETIVGMLIAFPFLLIRARFVATVLCYLWARFLFLLAGRTVRVTGLEKITRGKAYLVIANHSSYLDIPGIIAFFPDILWVGREKIFRVPVFGTFIKLLGSIPIDTKSVMRSGSAITAAVHQARKARSVAIFPEGTRTPDGKLQPFKRGFTRILRNSDLDILPLTLNGFYTLCPKDRWTVDPSKPLEIIVHSPVSRDTLLNKDDNTIAEIIHDIVQKGHKGW